MSDRYIMREFKWHGKPCIAFVEEENIKSFDWATGYLQIMMASYVIGRNSGIVLKNRIGRNFEEVQNGNN